MRFLVDEQLPPGMCQWLENRGHVADHVRTVVRAGSQDGEIAAYAEATRAILVTKDEDFLRLRQPDRFIVLWLRCGNTTNIALAAWLDRRWGQVETLLAAGERLIELR